jgi:hypothetical protein
MQKSHTLVIVVVLVMLSVVGGMMLWGADDERGQDALSEESDRSSVNASAPGSFFDTPQGNDAKRSARADTKASTGQKTGGGDPKGNWMSRMSEFDLDGDGFLSGEEKRAMDATMKGEWMSAHDLDGDGEMSPEEWDAYKQREFDNSAWGQELLRQFDLDGDGVLSAEEQAAMDAHIQELSEQKQQDELARLDTNGDGEISKDEYIADEEDWWADATERFDADGDGELNIDETERAWEAWVEYETVMDFLRRYDQDGNGSMGPSDYDAYLALYQAGDPAADVNRDGVLNSDDLGAYTSLVDRSRDQ